MAVKRLPGQVINRVISLRNARPPLATVPTRIAPQLPMLSTLIRGLTIPMIFSSVNRLPSSQFSPSPGAIEAKRYNIKAAQVSAITTRMYFLMQPQQAATSQPLRETEVLSFFIRSDSRRSYRIGRSPTISPSDSAEPCNWKASEPARPRSDDPPHGDASQILDLPTLDIALENCPHHTAIYAQGGSAGG